MKGVQRNFCSKTEPPTIGKTAKKVHAFSEKREKVHVETEKILRYY